MHSGLFESVADDGLASRFHHSGADEERFAAELGIAHADGVGLEVGDRSANLFLNRRIARAQPLESGQYGFDVSLIELFDTASGPIFRLGTSPINDLSEFGQMLAGMVEIDDLNGAGKVFIGNVPDPRRAISQDNDALGPLQAPTHRFGVRCEDQIARPFRSLPHRLWTVRRVAVGPHHPRWFG